MFKLNSDFIKSYKSKPENFGFNGLGKLVYERTYSRKLDDGSNEKWYQTIQRVVECAYTIQKNYIDRNNCYWNESQAQQSAQEMYKLMFDLKILPPGRGLWAMKPEILFEKNLYASLSNCAAVSTKNIERELEKPFKFLMDVSMLGCGCSFDTQGADLITIKKPITTSDHVISDTREGWVDSVGMLLNAYFTGGELPKFNYSLLRPAGTPLKTFGGFSSGPQPLIDLHNFLYNLLDLRIGQSLTSTNIVDIFNMIGKCVVAGGTRRTAELAFSEPTEEFMTLKNYDINPHRASYGWISNNSVRLTVGDPRLKDVVDKIIINGSEPGILWIDNMKHYGRLDDSSITTDLDPLVEMTNPCYAANTKLLTSNGIYNIQDLVGKRVKVWNSKVWTPAVVKITGYNQPILKIKFNDGTVTYPTPNHKFMLDNGLFIEANDLKPGSCIFRSKFVKCDTTVFLKDFVIECFNYDSDKNLVFYMGCKIVIKNLKIQLLEFGIRSWIVSLCSVNYLIIDNADYLGILDLINESDFNKLKKFTLSRTVYDKYITNVSSGLIVISVKPTKKLEDIVYCVTTEDDSHLATFDGIVTHNCGEIALESYELCNLVELFLNNITSYEEYLRCLKYAYLYAKTITLCNTHIKETNRVLLKNRRIGVSLSGVAQFLSSNTLNDLKKWLDTGYTELKKWDTIYSNWLAIPKSIKITTIKPSGTISLLAGATPGIHYPESNYYIRRVRINKLDPILKTIKGYTIVDDLVDSSNVCVEIPVHIPGKTIKDVSVAEQIALVAFFQKYWADNQVSFTCKFDDHDSKDILGLLEFYQYQLKGISFMKSNDKSYIQAPYESISKNEYNVMMLRQAEIGEAKGSDGKMSLYCDGDHCEVSW